MKGDAELAPLAMVVAVAPGEIIGKDGGLPWHLPEDLRHFRAVTMGHAMLMGRRTWESIGRALPGRRSIVLTRRGGLRLPDGVWACDSLDGAIELAREDGDSEPRIIGGAGLYAAAMPRATRLFRTEIRADYEGDTHFPMWSPQDWTEVSSRETKAAIYRELTRWALSPTDDPNAGSSE